MLYAGLLLWKVRRMFRRAPEQHEGATEDWSPSAELEPAAVPACAARTCADPDELRILADAQSLVESWRTDPDWLTEFRASVDAAFQRTDLNDEPHRRWRQRALDFDTAALFRDPETGEFSVYAVGATR